MLAKNKQNVVIDRLKDKSEKVQETKESIKTVIKETMQNKINEIEFKKKRAIRKH